MNPEYGAEVIDHNGQILGTVDHLIRNLNTGEIRKRKQTGKHLRKAALTLNKDPKKTS